MCVCVCVSADWQDFWNIRILGLKCINKEELNGRDKIELFWINRFLIKLEQFISWRVVTWKLLGKKTHVGNTSHEKEFTFFALDGP